MARLDFKFSFGKEVNSDFHVICVKKDQWQSQLDQELKDLATKYAFEGKEGQKFLHQTKDKARLVIACGENFLKTGRIIYTLTKDFPYNAHISLICHGFEKHEIQDIVIGLKLQAYEFMSYKTVFEESYKKRQNAFHIVSDLDIAGDVMNYDPVIDGVMFTKDLSNEPANMLYPETLAEQIKEKLKGLPITVKILDVPAMEKLGMGGILAVGRGSIRPPRMIILEYKGGPINEPSLAFVGKAVTFDTGGISIKPSASMEDMKHDMTGGATVAGLFYALAKRGAKVNVIGVIGAAENMADGDAYRPSDIVKTASGKTIEVLNTDAEGRVVLSDALWYASNYKPKLIIDLATLTGAITVGLSSIFAGIFTESDALAARLSEAAEAVGEPVWRMPLHKSFTKAIKSKIADVRNTSTIKGGGSSTAAAFLREFVPKEIDWCHMDIAGVAYGITSDHLDKEGASGFGVRLLDAFVREYEK
ncbi:MAG: leucyl aminopeptidase [Alphaproteobacteria bacterium]|nr:MAG: leucyl aminopeptidase [Alphaproteobacteria bacterium]